MKNCLKFEESVSNFIGQNEMPQFTLKCFLKWFYLVGHFLDIYALMIPRGPTYFMFSGCKILFFWWIEAIAERSLFQTPNRGGHDRKDQLRQGCFKL